MEERQMSLAKSGLLCVAAALIVSATAAAPSAVANFELTTTACSGELITLCYSTTEGGSLFEFKGEEEITASKEPPTTNFFKSTLGGEEVYIVCTSAGLAGGVIRQTEPLVAVGTLRASSVVFTGCKLEGKLGEKCVVLSPLVLTAELKTQPVVGTPATTEDVNVIPETGTTLIKLEFENNGTFVCPATVKGEKSVTGKQLCNLNEPGVDKALHRLICLPAGSTELLFAENPAELELTLDVTLRNASTDSWSLSLG
jgi:hypothetical protein